MERSSADASPERLRFSTQRPDIDFELVPELIAIHGGPPNEPGEDAVEVLDGGRITVQRAETVALSSPPSAVLGPVYRQVPGGSVAVPTGMVLVRFADGTTAAQQRDRLAAAGYDFVESLSYAPQVAWVRATGGEIATGLRNLDRLETLPGVQNVEPQMITEVGHRG